MIIAQYAHRLPSDYDIQLIKDRAQARGPLWDAVPELYFKGFLLRQRGHHGAIANEYSSLYLWRRADAFASFLTTGRYKTVTDSFGRADIQTRFVLDARKGSSTTALFAYKEELDLPVDADISTELIREIERNKEIAARPGTLASAVGVDAQDWKITRVLLSSEAPSGQQSGLAYQILHLARPLLDHLPPGTTL